MGLLSCNCYSFLKRNLTTNHTNAHELILRNLVVVRVSSWYKKRFPAFYENTPYRQESVTYFCLTTLERSGGRTIFNLLYAQPGNQQNY
jgi:hypothetical protein